MRQSKALLSAAAMATLGLTVLGTGAKADILPSDAPPVVVATPTTFIYNYQVFVTSTQTVNTGNSFTFYDFTGFTGTVFAPAGWSFTVQNLGPSPVTGATGSVIPNDLAGVANITFTRTGGAVVGGPTILGTFALESTLGPNATTVRAFTGGGTDTATGLLNANITNYFAPTASPAVIPEPGEWAFAGVFSMGLIGLMVRARRRSAGKSSAALAS